MKDEQIKIALVDKSIALVMADNRPQLWYEDSDQCQMCGRIQQGLARDHCHTTGFFRGWLCYACNSAEGQNRMFTFVAWRVLAPYLEPSKRRMWNRHGSYESMRPATAYLKNVPMIELLDLEDIMGYRN